MPINPRASGVHSKAEALDASTGQWRTLEPLVGNRAGAGAAVIDGQIYVGGGFNAQGIPQNVEVYDAETGRRIPGNHFSVLARIGAASATDGKRLFFFGGSPRGNGPPTGHVEAFDPTVRQSIIGLGVRPKNPDGGGGVVPPTAMNARPQSEARPGSLRRGFPDDIGVVIGVEKYDSLPSADFAVNDARGMSEFLTTALGLGERRVANFFGQGHTQMRVEMALAGPMRLSVRPNTRLFIFFSGHGIPDPESGEVSLALWDTDLGVPRRRGLPLSTLYRHLEMFEAKEIVVFLDACFSGTGPRSAPKPGLRPLVSQLESLKPKEKRISILSAAAGVQTAGTKKDAEHGLFSYYLLKGLAGEADGNGDKHLSLKELHSYLKKKVSADARRENRDQDPQLFTSNPDLNIY